MESIRRTGPADDVQIPKFAASATRSVKPKMKASTDSLKSISEGAAWRGGDTGGTRLGVSGHDTFLGELNPSASARLNGAPTIFGAATSLGEALT